MFSASKDRLAVGATFDHGPDRLLGLLHGHHRADLGVNTGVDHEADHVIHLLKRPHDRAHDRDLVADEAQQIGAGIGPRGDTHGYDGATRSDGLKRMLPGGFSDIVNYHIDPARQLFVWAERSTRPKLLGKGPAFGTPARDPRFNTGGVSHLNYRRGHAARRALDEERLTGLNT